MSVYLPMTVAASPAARSAALTPCELAANPSAFEGKVVTVSGKFDLGLEYFVLASDECPAIVVFLEPAESEVVGEPCASEALAKRVGCPLKSGAYGSATGTYHYKTNPRGFHTLKLLELSNLTVGDPPNKIWSGPGVDKVSRYMAAARGRSTLS
jgi:hypothetical protein